MSSASLVWFRQDLRLKDNPALRAALARGGPVVPVFIRDDSAEGGWAPGGASSWWLHHALASLDAALRERGSRLIFARGESSAVLVEIARKAGAGAVFWNERHEPEPRRRDREVRAALAAAGMETATSNSALFFDPAGLLNRQGTPFQVFTPFWRRCLELPVEPPVRVPAGAIPAPRSWPRSLDLAQLGFLPGLGWTSGLAQVWQPGEDGAARRLAAFVRAPMGAYGEGRDRPDRDGTSQLSPWLHFGELGPRQVWAAVKASAGGTGVFPPSRGAGVFLSEIGWREFAYHLLHHFPTTPHEPLRPAFRRFAWAEDPDGAGLRAWQQGATGYPIVDAGMRQLWRTGWMHNRVRMIAASFLVKDLRLPWGLGAAWFWDCLVDADLASNTLNWQWSAGCGADAAPYFRIFSPVRQGERFDPDGTYVRRWVPELARLPSEWIHCPWEAPPEVLAGAGVRLGGTYPRPVVEHTAARAAALTAFKALRAGVPEEGAKPDSAGERADARLRDAAVRLNRGRSPRASDIRPIA